MTFAAIGCVNDGHPVPDSNFVVASNNSVPQHLHSYLPGSKIAHISELKGISVPD